MKEVVCRGERVCAGVDVGSAEECCDAFRLDEGMAKSNSDALESGSNFPEPHILADCDAHHLDATDKPLPEQSRIAPRKSATMVVCWSTLTTAAIAVSAMHLSHRYTRAGADMGGKCRTIVRRCSTWQQALFGNRVSSYLGRSRPTM
jgi:hypothetical protein